MNVEQLSLGLIAANCWLITGERGAIVIDPGMSAIEPYLFLKRNADKECAVLLTHAHFDHIGGAAELREKTGVPIFIGAVDAPALADPAVNLSDRFHAHIDPFTADRLLEDGQEETVGDLHFTALETPGHTVGSMCYLFGNHLFSGDVLFAGTIGRTDFPGAKPEEMFRSLDRLMRLTDEVTVYPGHGEITTVGKERRSNPFLRE